MDQRGFDNQRVVLSAAEAARRLGVKRETLYAYVSRGLIRTVAGSTKRSRGYLRSDVERLKTRADARLGHAPVAAGALRWGEPVLESGITEVRADGPAYRGLSAVALASSGVSYEQVAALLWSVPDSPFFPPEGRPLEALGRLKPLLPPRAHPFVAGQLALAAFSAADPLRHGATRAQELVRARAVLPALALAAGLGLAPRRTKAASSQRSFAAMILSALGGEAMRGNVRLVEQALIVSADHELNASAFAARIAASAGADLYARLSAALAVLTGPRHGGLTDRVEAMVTEAQGLRSPETILATRLQRGEELPGYSHPLYPKGDPRATHLLGLTRPLRGRSAQLRTLFALVDAMASAGREPPSLDLGLVAICAATDLPPGSAAALFMLGRSAGWIAHALEQRESGVMLRPRARYVPPAPAPLV